MIHKSYLDNEIQIELVCTYKNLGIWQKKLTALLLLEYNKSIYQKFDRFCDISQNIPKFYMKDI